SVYRHGRALTEQIDNFLNSNISATHLKIPNSVGGKGLPGPQPSKYSELIRKISETTKLYSPHFYKSIWYGFVLQAMAPDFIRAEYPNINPLPELYHIFQLVARRSVSANLHGPLGPMQVGQIFMLQPAVHCGLVGIQRAADMPDQLRQDRMAALSLFHFHSSIGIVPVNECLLHVFHIPREVRNGHKLPIFFQNIFLDISCYFITRAKMVKWQQPLYLFLDSYQNQGIMRVERVRRTLERQWKIPASRAALVEKSLNAWKTDQLPEFVSEAKKSIQVCGLTGKA
ncbi:MAG: hypothetical protein AAGU32_05500, partial [Bacillota bacterium]